MFFSTPRLSLGNFGDWDGRGPWIYSYVPPGFECLTNSDIAGIGVVLSAIIASLWTTFASLLVASLDLRYMQSTIFTARRCLQCSEQRFKSATLVQYARYRLLLSTTVVVLADAQVFTGFAMLLSAFINLSQVQMSNASLLDFQDQSFTLAVYLSCLSSSSHLAALHVLSVDTSKTTTIIRVFVIGIFAVFLTITIDLSRYCFQPGFILMEKVLVHGLGMTQSTENVLEYVVPPIIMFWVFWISIAQLLKPMRDWILKLWPEYLRYPFSRPLNWLRDKKLGLKRYGQVTRPIKAIAHFSVFAHPLVILLVQVVFAGISVTCALYQKFTSAPEPTALDIVKGVGLWCSLNNPQDNAWSFGQTNALILLIIPVYSTIYTYLNESSRAFLVVASGGTGSNAEPDVVFRKGEEIFLCLTHTR